MNVYRKMLVTCMSKESLIRWPRKRFCYVERGNTSGYVDRGNISATLSEEIFLLRRARKHVWLRWPGKLFCYVERGNTSATLSEETLLATLTEETLLLRLPRKHFCYVDRRNTPATLSEETLLAALSEETLLQRWARKHFCYVERENTSGYVEWGNTSDTLRRKHLCYVEWGNTSATLSEETLVLFQSFDNGFAGASLWRDQTDQYRYDFSKSGTDYIDFYCRSAKLQTDISCQPMVRDVNIKL